jgi:hypothetical protein
MHLRSNISFKSCGPDKKLLFQIPSYSAIFLLKVANFKMLTTEKIAIAEQHFFSKFRICSCGSLSFELRNCDCGHKKSCVCPHLILTRVNVFVKNKYLPYLYGSAFRHTSILTPDHLSPLFAFILPFYILSISLHISSSPPFKYFYPQAIFR